MSASNANDLTQALQKRFDDLPKHKQGHMRHLFHRTVMQTNTKGELIFAQQEQASTALEYKLWYLNMGQQNFLQQQLHDSAFQELKLKKAIDFHVLDVQFNLVGEVLLLRGTGSTSSVNDSLMIVALPENRHFKLMGEIKYASIFVYILL